MIKKIYLIAIIIGICSVCCAQDAYRVHKIALKSKPLIELIKDYCHEYKDDIDQFGVIALKYDPTNKCYYLTHRMYKKEVEEWLPSFYSILNDRVILIYTGFESELNIQKENNIELLKTAEKFLLDPRTLIYHASIWKLTINGDKYNKEDVERIPLDY
jgi:hypothetical protein